MLARLKAGAPAPADWQTLLNDVTRRIEMLEVQTGEHTNPEYAIEYMDEERAGDYIAQLRDALIALAGGASGPGMIVRALAAVETNPYPRYRDIGLVALGVAALAVPDVEWTASRLETILEIGLEKEGVTFTFDLAAQLLAEAERRAMPAPELAEYLMRAEALHDRWGTRLRCLSARAAAHATQGDRPRRDRAARRGRDGGQRVRRLHVGAPARARRPMVRAWRADAYRRARDRRPERMARADACGIRSSPTNARSSSRRTGSGSPSPRPDGPRSLPRSA